MFSTSGASKAAAKRAEEMFFEELDAATRVNIKFAQYYAAGIVGLIALFMIVHWAHIIFIKTTARSNAIGRAFKLVSTPSRRVLKGYAAGTFLILPGRLLLALAYLGINLAIMFPQLSFTYNAVFLAKRCGWYEHMRVNEPFYC